MGDIIFNCPKGSLTLRDNYWDTVALKKNVMEITEWRIEDAEVQAFVEEFSQFLIQSDVELCMVRVPLKEKALMHHFQRSGAFLFTELSLGMSIDNMSRELNVNKRFLGHSSIREMCEKDHEAVEEIAATVFKHGRFAEDVLIPLSVHQLRQRNWARDLIQGPEEILVNETPTGVDSFMVYKFRSGDHVELILGGSTEGNAFSGVMFWHEIMQYFAQSGVQKVSTLVSAANTSVIRLYESLGFKIHDSLAGLHWHR